MKHRSIDRYFTEKMFWRQYVPALISAVVLSFGDVADGLVLGNSIGYIGLAAIALTMPVAQVFNVIMNALGIGGSIRFSQQMARGKREEALAGFQGVLCVTVLAGIGIAALGNILIIPLLRLLGTKPDDGALFDACRIYLAILLLGTPVLFLNYVLNYYLKNDDLEKKASLAFTAGNITDIVMNVILVLVLKMGVAGASLATVLGQMVGMGISVAVIYRKAGILRLFPWKPDLSGALSSFKNGFSASAEFLYSMVFLVIANHLLLRTAGGAGVAVLDVVLSVSYFAINLFDASAKSPLPVISTYCGEYNEDGARCGLKTGLLASLGTGMVFGIFVFCFPALLCRFFGMTEVKITEAGEKALRWYACSIPPAGICAMLAGYYEACRKENAAFLLTTLRGVFPVFLALLFFLFAPDRFWSLYLLTEILTMAIFAVYRCFAYRPPFARDRILRETIYSRNDEISMVTEKIDGFCRNWGIPPKKSYMSAMAVEELCVATQDNGFRRAEDGFFQITLILLEDGCLELHIRDNADAFNPLAMEFNRDVVEEEMPNLDALGIAAIKKKAKDFSYRHYQGFNTIIFRF